MTSKESEYTAEDWSIIRSAAASVGLAVIALDELTPDGHIPSTADVKIQIADALSRSAVGYLQRKAVDKAKKACKIALSMNRECHLALACELAILHQSGRRSPIDDLREVENGHRDPFVVALSYQLMNEPKAARLQARNEASESAEHLITEATLLTGFFYWKAVELHPNFSEPLTNLAATLVDLGALIGAEELMERALEINPHDGHAHHNLALEYIRQERYGDALLRMRSAIAKHHPQAREMLGYLEEQLQAAKGRLRLAESGIEKTQELYRIGKYREALQVVGTGELESSTLIYRGHCLRLLGRFEEAAAAFETAAAAGAGLQASLFAAFCYKKAERYSEAISVSTGVVDEDPLLLDTYYVLADTYRHLGDRDREAGTVRSLFLLDQVLGIS